MGLKGYGLWVNLIQRAEPHHAVAVHKLNVKANFEQPGFHFMVSRG
jgi:hypothetical protein